MRVENNGALQAFAAYRTTVQPARATNGSDQTVEATTEVQPSTNTQISVRGKERAAALDAVRTSPVERQDLVAELRAQVQNGTYQIDDAKLAGNIARAGVLD